MLETLFINWNVSPEIFSIGPISIRWYSVLFISGFILGWYIFKWFFQREGIPVKLLDPLLYTLLIGTIVGSRLGHCLFYQPEYYLGSWDGFVEIFMPWKGGLASHGGTIALIFAMIWFARHYGRRHNFDFLWIMDVTELPWGFIFERRGETFPKHPTQLYEALSYLILGVVLILLYKYRLHKMYRGTFIGLFFIGCFGMRFLIEFIKEPQVGFEEQMALNMGQCLSIPFVLLGIGLLVYAFIKKQPAAVQHPKKEKPKASTFAKSLA